MRRQVLAVVGHVDHGKTSLVKALTGTDTDTLPEERARGLTVSLGFAVCALPGGTLNLIDAPGHADFLRTTVSGLSGVEAILLVVSAEEGIQAQTVQHVGIAGLLGIRRAIVAIAKCELADESRCLAVAGEVSGLMRQHGFRAPRLCPCSAATGAGIDALTSALAELVVSPGAPDTLPGFYLPIDRVFSPPGAGTVVTGTLLGGTMAVDDDLAIEPRGHRSRVRTLQVNGETVGQAGPGTRIAVNLRGTPAASLSKGDVLCAPDRFASANRMDVVLVPPAGTERRARHMEESVVLLGTGHAAARLNLYDLGASEPGTPQYAQLIFQTPRIAFAGQHFVLQHPASGDILAGGRVLDPTASDWRRKRPLQARVLAAAAAGHARDIASALAARDGGCVGLDELARLARCSEEACLPALAAQFEMDSNGVALDRTTLAEAAAAYVTRLEVLHAERPCRPWHAVSEIHAALRGLHPVLLDQAAHRLEADGRIRRQAGHAALRSHDPVASMTGSLRASFDQLEASLRAAALRPGLEAALACEGPEAEDLVDLLVWCGKAVRLYNHALRQTVLLHVDALAEAALTLAAAFPAPTRFTTSEARETLGTNRKIIVPLLEYFDQQEFTKRQENLRYFKVKVTDQSSLKSLSQDVQAR